jgi:hypothetical protein
MTMSCIYRFAASYDAAIVSTASGSAGGQYLSGCFTTDDATLMTTTKGPEEVSFLS